MLCCLQRLAVFTDSTHDNDDENSSHNNSGSIGSSGVIDKSHTYTGLFLPTALPCPAWLWNALYLSKQKIEGTLLDQSLLPFFLHWPHAHPHLHLHPDAHPIPS